MISGFAARTFVTWGATVRAGEPGAGTGATCDCLAEGEAAVLGVVVSLDFDSAVVLRLARMASWSNFSKSEVSLANPTEKTNRTKKAIPSKANLIDKCLMFLLVRGNNSKKLLICGV
jgi:hypothetical protein